MPRLVALTLLLISCSAPLLAQRGGGGAPRGSSAPAASGSHTTPYQGQYSTTPGVITTAHADDESKVEFRSESVLVQVPAVVTDKSGSHIHSLSKDDFEVLENGKAQKISLMQEVTATDARLQSPESLPGTFSNAAMSGEQAHSIAVIALDTVNTPFLDQTYGREQLLKFLGDNLESNSAMALLTIGSKGVRVLSGFGTDPAVLVQALKKVRGELPAMTGVDQDAQAAAATASVTTTLVPLLAPGGDPQAQIDQFALQGDAIYAGYQQSRAVENTMQAFLGIALSLSGIPGRKSLLWCTGGFPFYLDSPSTVPGGYLSVLYERTMEALNDAQISVYPVDVRGLVNYSPVADAKIGGAMSGPALATRTTNRSWLQSSTISTLQEFASMTGGRAYYNSNDLVTGFRRAIEDGSSYYLLGYYLDTHNTKPGWRKLQVKVHRKDVEVRARTGFLVTNATVNPEVTHKADVGFALTSPFDSTGIPLTVKWQGMAADGDKKKVGFAMHLPFTGITVEPERNHYDVDFAVQAMKDGEPKGNIGQEARGDLPAENLAKLKAEGIFYGNALELPAGSYQVRFVVRDNLSGRIGSVTAPLTVN